MSKKILILWYTINDNFGDVLLFHTEKKWFEERGYSVDFEEVGKHCDYLLPKANKYDFLLFAGGGIIERHVPNVIRYFKEDLHMLKVPYGVMGLSVGEFFHKEHIETLKCFAENAVFFYTRDEYTATYFNTLCQRNIAKYSADVVFSYYGFNKYKTHIPTMYGINIRNVPYPDLSGDLDWKLVDDIVMQENISLLIPDESEVHKCLDSIKISNQIYENYKALSAIDKAELTLNEISKCEIVIAMRFHVVLSAAMIENIIPIPITYCPKVDRLSEQLGISELALNINELHKLPEILSYTKNNKNEILRTIRKNVIRMKARADKMFYEIETIMKEY